MIRLSARGISKHFGATQALRDVSIDIEAGTFHALVGENGAGKSTLGKIVAGVIQPDAGEIIWEGKPVHLATPLDAQRLGIGIIFQELDLFPHLSIADNLSIANLDVERGAMLNRGEMARFARPLMDSVGLRVSPWTAVADLSIGQRQLVAIARALGMKAKLIVMDEPTSSLPDSSAERLFALIADLKEQGVAIVYVSHKMNEVFRLADRISVLRDGAHIGTRRASETSPAEVIAMMVGRELSDRAPRPVRSADRVLLAVSGLSTRKLRNISFELRAGEVLGIAGLVGSGRSSLAEALFGLSPETRGNIRLAGRPYEPRSPAHAIASGIGLQPEDRKSEGLMMQMSVLENASVAVLHRIQRAGFILRGEERRRAGAILARMRLKAASQASEAGSLSGGNQQKVLLGRWLLVDPEVLILDDPTRGIDVGAKRDIYELIDELAAQAKGVIFISSELPELLACSDRILVLSDGECVATLDARVTTQEEIMRLATRTAP